MKRGIARLLSYTKSAPTQVAASGAIAAVAATVSVLTGNPSIGLYAIAGALSAKGLETIESIAVEHLAEGLGEFGRLKPGTEAFRNHHLPCLIGKALAHIISNETAVQKSKVGGVRFAEIAEPLAQKVETHWSDIEVSKHVSPLSEEDILDVFGKGKSAFERREVLNVNYWRSVLFGVASIVDSDNSV